MYSPVIVFMNSFNCSTHFSYTISYTHHYKYSNSPRIWSMIDLYACSAR